jgi:uncharacterized protein (DUF4213/DUF364 family)
MIYEKLIDQALAQAKNNTVADIRIGLRYTAVLLSNGSCGLAFTFQSGSACGCHLMGEAGRMTGKPASELVPLLAEKNLLRASVGLAAVNAVLNTPGVTRDDGNVTEALQVSAKETFGMVGEFKPIIAAMKKVTERIYVFEQNLSKGPDLYPEEAIPDYLPKCDVVVVTATSIINHTIDGVLSHCKNARQVAVVGPSTPLYAGAFAGTPVTLLAGSVVRDTDQLLKIISQAGGTMHMKPAIDQVMVRI